MSWVYFILFYVPLRWQISSYCPHIHILMAFFPPAGLTAESDGKLDEKRFLWDLTAHILDGWVSRKPQVCTFEPGVLLAFHPI